MALIPDNARAWWFHAVFVLLWPAVLVGAALAAFLPAVVVESVSGAAIGGLTAVAIVAGLGSFAAYHADAKRLGERGSDWRPTWWAWIVGQLLLTPIVVAPLYVARRYQRVGLN